MRVDQCLRPGAGRGDWASAVRAAGACQGGAGGLRELPAGRPCRPAGRWAAPEVSVSAGFTAAIARQGRRPARAVHGPGPGPAPLRRRNWRRRRDACARTARHFKSTTDLGSSLRDTPATGRVSHRRGECPACRRALSVTVTKGTRGTRRCAARLVRRARPARPGRPHRSAPPAAVGLRHGRHAHRRQRCAARRPRCWARLLDDAQLAAITGLLPRRGRHGHHWQPCQAHPHRQRRWPAGPPGPRLRRHDPRFATDLTVGFTSNQAERDVRPVKVQMRISAAAATWWRADFAIVQSYSSTAWYGYHASTPQTAAIHRRTWSAPYLLLCNDDETLKHWQISHPHADAATSRNTQCPGLLLPEASSASGMPPFKAEERPSRSSISRV